MGDHVGFVAEILAGDDMLGVRMSDDVTVVVDDKDFSSADAGVLQAVENGVERNDSGEHAGEIVLGIFQGHGDYECRAIIRSEGQRIAAKFYGLNASDEGALQGFGDERILLSAEISL